MWPDGIWTQMCRLMSGAKFSLLFCTAVGPRDYVSISLRSLYQLLDGRQSTRECYKAYIPMLSNKEGVLSGSEDDDDLIGLKVT